MITRSASADVTACAQQEPHHCGMYCERIGETVVSCRQSKDAGRDAALGQAWKCAASAVALGICAGRMYQALADSDKATKPIAAARAELAIDFMIRASAARAELK